MIKLGAIGDVIRTTSVLHGLKEKYKGCSIDWVTKKESFDILKNNGLIDRVFMIGNAKKDLKGEKYDLVICLDDENEACELASGIDSKKIVGAFLDDGKRAYTEDSSQWFDMGLLSRLGKQKADELKAKNSETYQEIMYRILGLDYKKQEPILALNEDELNFGEGFVQKNNIKKDDLTIGINTGAGGRWEDKKLSVEKTAELIDKLNKSLKNCKILLFGGPEEIERNEKIRKLAKTKIIDAGCRNSLMEFASLVNLCGILVTSDSLALHIGVALKKRVICYFYPTSADEIELYGRGEKIIWEGKSYCSYQPKCKYPPRIEIEKIIEAVKRACMK